MHQPHGKGSGGHALTAYAYQENAVMLFHFIYKRTQAFLIHFFIYLPVFIQYFFIHFPVFHA